ncbi:hypothetical protein Gotur_031326 [Gossypium turneri]
MFSPLLVFASIFSACCLATSTFGATLAIDEVEALKSIGRTLGKTNWNFSVDPCSSGDESWAKFAESNAYYVNNVTCVCSSIICHVSAEGTKSIRYSPTTVDQTPLPPRHVMISLATILVAPFLLNGVLCSNSSKCNSLLGNRLTGLIPEELANMSSLTSL